MEAHLDIPELYDLFAQNMIWKQEVFECQMKLKRISKNLQKFYTIFTGKSSFRQHTPFWDIPLTDYNKSSICKYRNLVPTTVMTN